MLTVFSESEEFYVNDNYEDQLEQEDEITELEFFVFNNKDVENQGDLCLNFYFYFEPETEDIYIERAFTSTCGGVTGTEILNKMGMVFLLLKRKYEVTMKIRLDEAELKFLGIKKSLSWLYLFKRGESWYNSKGYKEHNYDKNKQLIEEFIRRKVVDVYNKEELDLIYSISDQETIQALFIKICDILKEEDVDCCKYIKLLNITIDKFMEFLKTQSSNDFMCTKFYELWYNPDKSIEDYLNAKIEQLPPLPVEEGEEGEGEEKGGSRRRKRQSIKNKKNRSIKKKRTKHRMKIVKKRKSKKAIKKRTKKHRK